jgi:hypothetical protein
MRDHAGRSSTRRIWTPRLLLHCGHVSFAGCSESAAQIASSVVSRLRILSRPSRAMARSAADQLVNVGGVHSPLSELVP